MPVAMARGITCELMGNVATTAVIHSERGESLNAVTQRECPDRTGPGSTSFSSDLAPG